MKTRENTEVMMPVAVTSSVVAMTMANAGAEPRRRSRANPSTLWGLPPGSNAGPGFIMRQMPVNAWSNSFMVTVTLPRAGSASTARSPLKPHSTTKWLKFQWRMQGNCPCSRSAAGSKR